ncbi:MAG: hypothetical protein IJ711_04010 [Lachnospiraceae bacterium]|nr:hypothetical protein [Lachnospiraceae bacterium]
MFTISLKQMKNCIEELECAQRELGKVLTGLENVYAGFDSLTSGTLDKQILRAVIDEVSEEKRGLAGLKEGLAQTISLYEQTEQKASHTGTADLGGRDIGLLDLRAVRRTMESLGIFFE